MAQDTVRQPVAVLLLTGFLGAGKTTTLNHLLNNPLFEGAGLSLLINEFGKMGVDGALVTPGQYSKFEINSGSIFCACTQAELLKTLMTIAQELHPDYLIIEATGIAQTCDIERILMMPTYRDAFTIMGNLCIVDAENFIRTAAFMKAAIAQVHWADALLINKIDCVTEGELAQLRDVLSSLNSRAIQRTVEYGSVPENLLGQLSHTVRPLQPTDQRPEAIVSMSFEANHAVDKTSFFDAIGRLDDKILRLKGNVRFTDGVRFVEKVHERMIEKPARENLSIDTAFTIIGWNTNKQEIADALSENCTNILR